MDLKELVEEKIPDLFIEGSEADGYHWQFRCDEREDKFPTVEECVVNFAATLVQDMDIEMGNTLPVLIPFLCLALPEEMPGFITVENVQSIEQLQLNWMKCNLDSQHEKITITDPTTDKDDIKELLEHLGFVGVYML